MADIAAHLADPTGAPIERPLPLPTRGMLGRSATSSASVKTCMARSELEMHLKQARAMPSQKRVSAPVGWARGYFLSNAVGARGQLIASHLGN